MLPLLRSELVRLPRRCYRLRLYSTEAQSDHFELNGVRERMIARKLPLLLDRINEKQEMLLANTLSEFLPSATKNTKILAESEIHDKPLRHGHHLIYFPPTSLLSELLPDGTDPDQSPGGPFVRRMWAGGRVRFPKTAPPLKTNHEHACCFERISDVQIKGKEGDEKIFVTIERRMSSSPQLRNGDAWASRDQVTELLMDEAQCGVIEERNIVFMKERTPAELAKVGSTPAKNVKAPHPPSASHVYVPSRALLFRFSALTWNAHSIHLDKGYCRDIEGHRDLLVHGPLSLVMLLELLQRYQAGDVPSAPHTPFSRVDSFEYRNIAPLYAGEECKVCLRQADNGKYELWIENSEGGMCVKATATTE